MEEKKWCVYKHTAPNGKVYIGITCHQNNITRRFGQNGNGYKTQRKFYRAIKKYGWENFNHEILEKNLESLDLANEREQYYIDLFDSHKNGYNSTDGGDGTLGRFFSDEERKIRSEKMSGENNHMYGKSGVLSPNYGVHFSEEHKRKISESNKGKKLSNETKHKLSIIAKQRNIPSNKMELYMMDENLNIVKEFSSGIEAAEYVGVKPQQIYDALHKLNNYTVGYYWCRKENYLNFIENFIPHNKVITKAVHKCDLQNNILKTYESFREANRQTGVDRKSIKQCCENIRKTAGGYIWRYAVQ